MKDVILEVGLPPPQRVERAKQCGASMAIFSTDHAVDLGVPIQEAFRVLGTAVGLEQSARLSYLCTHFALTSSDRVHLDHPLPGSSSQDLPCQRFELQETVPLFFGFFSKLVQLTGSLVWDEAAHVALYESLTDIGISIRKLRTFQVLDDGRTRVRERVDGQCPAYLKLIVDRETRRRHREHMEAYHTLFKAA